MPAVNPTYRNRRRNFYQDKGPDSLTVGSIINTFKVKSSKNSYDSTFVPTSSPVNGTSAYINVSGNASPEDNPDYQYEGYLYCDGSEYNIADYPLLFSVIGNSYGGTAAPAVKVLTGGNNYAGATIVSFSAAPTGGVTATGFAIVSSGIITGININNPGSGYVTAPTITLSNTGGGAGATFSVRINRQGVVTGITQDNVFEFWPDSSMGTFNVPDLKAKKIVGRGPVYGSGSPTIGNAELSVGIETISGKWYLDAAAQKQQFNIGNVKTTGYDKVTDTISGNIIGSQTITLQLVDKRLQGPPQHNHILLHSEAPQLAGGKSGTLYDSYVTGYSNTTGKITAFSPSGGIALTHSHALVRKAITDKSVATYDLYNYTGGDTGLGTSNKGGNISASGASGTFQLVTYTPSPTFKIFNSASQIGGRTILTAGTPIYSYTTTTYSTAGSYSYSLPTTLDELEITVRGGGASGGVYDKAGNNGSSSTVIVGNSGLLSITAGGGNGGGAAGFSSAGQGGLGGTNTISGSISSKFNVQSNNGGATPGYLGGNGGAGPYWKNVNPTAPTAEGAASATGSSGKNLTVTNQVDLSTVTFTSSNAGPFSVTTTSNNYGLVHVKFELYGGKGANCGNYGAAGCTTGVGGFGKYFRVKVLNPSVGNTFGCYPGNAGLPYNGTSSSTYGTASGGPGGDGYQTNDGGGGASGTILTGTVASTTIILAGAGGGGGGGGYGEGQCGDNAVGNTINDGVQATTSNLFSGAGGNGGNYGCTGGGGGGGGGGVGLASQTGAAGGGADGSGTAGGPGGGGGGAGGHGGGYGGARGLSSYRSDFLELEASGDSPTASGQINVLVREDRSYYTSFAGGGGSGGYVKGNILYSDLFAAGVSGITITVGSGGSGVSNQITNSTTNISTAGTDGQVVLKSSVITGYEGGTTSVSVGDIIKKASNGIEIYTTGTGSGTAGGFKLPTTQVPVVEITPQGSGTGAGATATATISGGIVSGLTLGSGGNGYTAAPKVRFLHGAGSGALATTTITSGGSVNQITLSGTQTAYTHYVKFGGTELTRYVILQPFDCTNVNRIGVKAARGNNINGGEKPDDSADELRVYYNTDGSDNFVNFIGVIVPRPSDAEIASNYDGTGSGTEATRWYTYRLNIPEGAQTTDVQFKIVQERTTASGANDNGGNTDQYGICEFFYDYKLISETQFVATPGEISASANQIAYTVEGPGNAAYSAGIGANDVRFTMSSSIPILPTPFLDPKINIPLVEPYALTKYLIKAY